MACRLVRVLQFNTCSQCSSNRQTGWSHTHSRLSTDNTVLRLEMDILKFTSTKVTFVTISLLVIAKNGAAIHCFQCDSTSERTCAESLPQHHSLVAESCSYVQEAQYCVKMTGVFEGELGTKRFCSARDWGNYCQWVRRPGDEREYRACVFTCWGNSCNGAHSAARTPTLLLLLVPALILTFHRAWP